MSWQDAHRYRDALRAAESDLDRTGGELVWRSEYAEVFGSVTRLRQALRSHWRTLLQAQADWDFEFAGRMPSAQVRRLVAAHPGLVAALGIDAAPAALHPAGVGLRRAVLEGAA
jgi:hypothetical protein